jgi:hypothetical protein
MFNKSVEPYPIKQLSREEVEDLRKEGSYTPVNLFDMMDSAVIQAFHYTEEQYDRFCEEATDEELDLAFKKDKTYSEAKQLVHLLNRFR